MKLGARILKTGIAITLAILLAQQLHLPSPVFAGIAAVFAIQPSIYRSYLSVLEQLQSNVIGAVLAIIFVLVFGNNPFIIGLTAVIVIAINLKLKIENTIGLALVTVIAIMENTSEQFVEFAVIRFLTIMLGVLSAFVVNLVFLPPKYETKLYYKIVHTTEEIIKWTRMNIRQASEHTLLKEDIERIKEKMNKMEQLFALYKEERTYQKKKVFVKSRKLVLFRQMIVTTTRGLETLKLLNRLEHDMHHMPKTFQNLIKSEIDCLLTYHEQVMLKFVRKIKTQHSETMVNEVCSSKRALINDFMKHRLFEDEEENKMVYHLFPLVAALVEYSAQLEHLDKLIDSFHSYHKEVNEFNIQEEEENE
jgi:uncharacterized membrane protein YgaE (UPF0421/DUF939 family)